MSFGGNKNIIAKIVIAFVIVFFVFGLNSNFTNAQTASTGPLQQEIEKCEEDGKFKEQQGCTLSKKEYNDTKEQIRLNTLSTEKQDKISINNSLIESAQSQIVARERLIGDCLNGLGACSDPNFNKERYIDTLENDIETYRNRIEDYQDEVDDLTKDINAINEDIKDLTSCGTFQFDCWLKKGFASWVTFLTNSIISIVGLILRVASYLLNAVVHNTILNASELINGNNSIKNSWLVFRDLINILFIFGLLYISITTIVSGLGGKTKKMLSNIILSALLINFSFFFTGVLIDASNFLTTEIYSQLGECAANDNPGAISSTLGSFDNGIANCFMEGLNLETAFDPTKEGFAKAIFPDGGSGQNSFSQEDSYWKIFRDGLIGALLGSVFIIITSFVFVSLAIMLVIRFVMLIILLITSPVMFLGWVLPKFAGISKKWGTTLTENLLWVPFSFLFLLITLKITEGLNLVGGDTAFETLLNYGLLITFIIASIMVAKKLGAAGASFATKYAGVATTGLAARGASRGLSSLGRNTLGRGSGAIADRIQGQGRIANTFRKGLKGVAGSSFDARNTAAFQGVATKTGLSAGTGITGGYQQRLEQKAADKKEHYEDTTKLTFKEQRDIDTRTRKIEENSIESRKNIKEENKEIKKSQERIEDLNSQKRNFSKDSVEYKELEKQTTEIQKDISKRKNNIKSIEKEIVEANKEDIQAIESIENQAKNRGDAYLEKLKGRSAKSNSKVVNAVRFFNKSNNKAVSQISEVADKDYENFKKMIKDHKKISERKNVEENQEVINVGTIDLNKKKKMSNVTDHLGNKTEEIN